MKSDPDALVSAIGAVLVTVTAAETKPARLRIHPLDVQALERRYPITEKSGYTLSESIRKLMGVPMQQDCGVRRGRPEVDWDE